MLFQVMTSLAQQLSPRNAPHLKASSRQRERRGPWTNAHNASAIIVMSFVRWNDVYLYLVNNL
jgi:hypothetical protein